MSDDKVVSIFTGKKWLDTEEAAKRVSDLDKCIAIGSKDGALCIIITDDYKDDEILVTIEQALWYLKMEVFGLPDFEVAD